MDDEGGRAFDYEVVTVSYHSRPLVERILAALGPDVPVALVDNLQGGDGLDEVAAARPNTRYMHGPGRGYAAGANLGGLSSAYPKLVFVNPDCVPSVELIDRLTGDLDRDPTIAVVAAVQVDGRGRPDLGIGGWEPSVPRALVHAAGLHKLLPTAGLWARPKLGRPMRLDWLGGGVYAIPSAMFHRLGGYDEGYFVYSEDVEFGRAARAVGLRVELRTDMVVEHGVAGSGDSKARMLRVRGMSMMRYLRRHHPRRRVEGVRAALVAGMAARWVMCRATGNHVQAEEHAAYVRGLTAPARSTS